MDDRERNPDRGDPSYTGRDASSQRPRPDDAQVVQGPSLDTPVEAPGAGNANEGCAGEARAAVQETQPERQAAEVVYLRDRRAKRGKAVQQARRPAPPRTTSRRQGFEPWYWYMGSHDRADLSAHLRSQRVSSPEPVAHSAWGEKLQSSDAANAASDTHSRSWLYTVFGVVERLLRKLQGPPSVHAGPTSSDECIRWEVNKRLAQQGSLDPSGIDVEVSNGEVTLCGTTESRHDKYVAEEIADDVSGVIDVHNRLRVRQSAGVLPFSKSGRANGEPDKSGPSTTRNARR